jgi:hypothetical protein
VEEPGHFRSVAIETGFKSDGWVEVDGIGRGVPVVSNGSFHLKTILKRSEIQADDD